MLLIQKEMPKPTVDIDATGCGTPVDGRCYRIATNSARSNFSSGARVQVKIASNVGPAALVRSSK